MHSFIRTSVWILLLLFACVRPIGFDPDSYAYSKWIVNGGDHLDGEYLFQFFVFIANFIDVDDPVRIVIVIYAIVNMLGFYYVSKFVSDKWLYLVAFTSVIYVPFVLTQIRFGLFLAAITLFVMFFSKKRYLICAFFLLICLGGHKFAPFIAIQIVLLCLLSLYPVLTLITVIAAAIAVFAFAHPLFSDIPFSGAFFDNLNAPVPYNFINTLTLLFIINTISLYINVSDVAPAPSPVMLYIIYGLFVTMLFLTNLHTYATRVSIIAVFYQLIYLSMAHKRNGHVFIYLALVFFFINDVFRNNSLG